MLGYRLISQESLLIPRSFCPQCKQIIAWYDNIPLFSWILLKQKCRSCSASISWLYPFIELVTTLVFCSLFVFVPSHYWWAYGLFFSALLVTIRTDCETLLISRFVTLFIVPLGFLLSYFQLLPISVVDSMLGAASAYAWLYLVGWVFHKFTGKIGLGQGDFELMAFIGSFLGIIGWWFSLLLGSLLGSVIGISYLVLSGQSRNTKIPFGPFLALGAILFVFFKEMLLSYVLY